MEIELNGETYELPKLTITLQEMLDTAGSQRSTRAAFEKQLEAVQKVLGKDAAAKVLDGKQLKDIDLMALATTFSAVVTAYQKPLLEAQAASLEERFGTVSTALEPILKAIEASEKAQGLKSSH